MFQIITRKKVKKNVKRIAKDKICYFDDIWNAEFIRSLKQLNQILFKYSCPPIEEFVSFSDDEEIVYDNVSLEEIIPTVIMDNCDLNFSIGNPKEKNFAYYPVSIIYFKYEEYDEIKEPGAQDSIVMKVLKPYYKFVVGTIYSTEEVNKMAKNGQHELNSSLLHSVYNRMIFDLDMSKQFRNNALSRDFAFPLISSRILKNWKSDSIRTFIEYDERGQASFKEVSDYISKEYEVNVLNQNGCNYGYEVKVNQINTNLKGMFVSSDKFFLPRRLKIVSVDDIPWETYKRQFCEK